jgi:cell division protein FtsW
MSSATTTFGTLRQRVPGLLPAGIDPLLLVSTLLLLALGWVMVTSASLEIAERNLGNPLHYMVRQGIYLSVAIGVALLVIRLPLALWQRLAVPLLGCGLLLLTLVLIPGVGRSVNGAVRWLSLGPINVQVSELAKLFIVIYLADYLVRFADHVRNHPFGLFRPMILVAIAGLLLVLEPDFGAFVVLFATALVMLFLGRVVLWPFILMVALGITALILLAISSPYRMNRITAFLDPWADPFNSGFQLTQALIAIGRGEWFGVGLGAGVQKLFYLPEAHTDFLFAVLAEELGMAGVVVVIVLFGIVVWRSFSLAAFASRAGNGFATHLAHGIGTWIGLQAFVNMGVNMGILPTKGLTLPLMSYGGSSLVTMTIAVALILRVGIEAQQGRSKR